MGNPSNRDDHAPWSFKTAALDTYNVANIIIQMKVHTFLCALTRENQPRVEYIYICKNRFNQY